MVLSTLRLGLAFLLASHAACLTLEKRQSCTGQSCIVANIAGNSGVPVDPSKPPQGDTVKGDCCVIRYNPAVTELAYQFKPQLKTQCAKYNNRRDLQDAEPLTDDQEMYKRSIELLSEDMDLEDEAGLETRQIGCAAKTLVYAKGTFEPGALGVTLGPKLKQALLKLAPGQWDVEGVDYQPSTDGDYCLGLPGGVAGKQLIQSIAAKCPRTKLFVAGYSQGAMVVRNVSPERNYVTPLGIDGHPGPRQFDCWCARQGR